MMPSPVPRALQPSQASQRPVALTQHKVFKASQVPPVVTARKVQETRTALGFVTLVTL